MSSSDLYRPDRRHLGRVAMAGSAAVAAATLFSGTRATAQTSTLLQIVERARDLSHFERWVKQAGLESEFTAAGNIALFVPHDEAIERLTAAQRQQIEGSRDSLRTAVLAHLADYPYQILAGGGGESDGGSGGTVRAKAGNTIVITNGGRALPRVNNFAIFVANMRAVNGIAHCIDGVLTV
ncbi:MAG TPA: fasciclin domain-containing protein [Falsiroseomonas sp.]|jgi:uncharacterized surface protein with fasciclin (FAS1) repeats|nr:fasciclin domain-containing protein [Falsiroseomonas sp.]